MSKYPIYLELEGKRVLVIGAGAVALRKARSLQAAGARLVVVAEKTDDMLVLQGKPDKPELIRARYSKEYLTGAVLVIAATNNPKINQQIYKDCQELEILCNVVDQPELCDFFLPAVVSRGDLQIAVCTEGSCPAYAGHLRKKLEAIFTEQHGRFLSALKGLRKQILLEVPEPARRKAIFGELADDESFEYFIKNGPTKWQQKAEEIIKKHVKQT
jgi:precorrin-2 dehydrogenase/sirohydrochlorin ferrochelatase